MNRRTRLDQNRAALTAEIVARRNIAEAVRGRRRPRRRKLPNQAHPRGEALRYRRALLALVRLVAAATLERVSAPVERLAAVTRQADPSVRTDAPADDIGEIFGELEDLILTPDMRQRVRSTAGQMVRGVVSFNRRELNRVFEATIGVGLNPLEPYLDDAIAAATRENVRRITSLLRSEFDQAEEQILSGFRQGLRHTEIMKNIQARFDVTESRAKLIARDQVSKLNGELTRLRQTSLGVTKYTWRSSQDERVRDTHQDFDGNVYSWETGSPEGHPGEPVNCRCVAEPVLDELLQETESAALETEAAARRAA